MLRRWVLVTVVLGGWGLGCGLRDQPLSWDGAVLTGTGGGRARRTPVGEGAPAGKGGAAGRTTDGGTGRAELYAGHRLRAGQPLSRGTDDLLGGGRVLHRHAAAPGERHRLRREQGL